jgi:hypothetical protein
MSRVRNRPSNSACCSGSHRRCHRRTRRSGDALISKKISLAVGFMTRCAPRRASTMPGIVHNVKVLTTVSTHASARGMRSPGRARNSTISAVRRRRLSARGPSLDLAQVRRSCRRVLGRNVQSSPPNRRQPPARFPVPEAAVVGDDPGLVPGLPARSRVADKSGLSKTPWPSNSNLSR